LIEEKVFSERKLLFLVRKNGGVWHWKKKSPNVKNLERELDWVW
jgi:hypothetical protein